MDDDDRLDPWDEPAAGVVLEAGRGALPFALIHGEPLVACAAWALGEAGITPLDVGTPWQAVVDAGEPLVLHDALCPMAPADYLAGCVRTAVERTAVVVGVRPVTDTVKAVADGMLGRTVDREDLVAVCTPLVVPPALLSEIGPWALDGAIDLADLVAGLPEGLRVEQVPAPPQARRVGDEDDVRLLEALTAP